MRRLKRRNISKDNCRARQNDSETESKTRSTSEPRPAHSARRKRTANQLFYCLFLLVVCPLSQVCVSVAGGGRGLVTPAMADFSDNCPRDCNCKWANGKREADCTRAGFTTIPTNLNHEIQILRMTYNYVRILGKNVYKSAGLLNLQRIFMNHCHVQVRNRNKSFWQFQKMRASNASLQYAKNICF